MLKKKKEKHSYTSLKRNEYLHMKKKMLKKILVEKYFQVIKIK